MRRLCDARKPTANETTSNPISAQVETSPNPPNSGGQLGLGPLLVNQRASQKCFQSSFLAVVEILQQGREVGPRGGAAPPLQFRHSTPTPKQVVGNMNVGQCFQHGTKGIKLLKFLTVRVAHKSRAVPMEAFNIMTSPPVTTLTPNREISPLNWSRVYQDPRANHICERVEVRGGKLQIHHQHYPPKKHHQSTQAQTLRQKSGPMMGQPCCPRLQRSTVP